MTEQELEKYFSRSGAALADLILPAFVARIKDELYTEVAQKQRLLGELEEAAVTANAKRGADEKKSIELQQTAAKVAEKLKANQAALQDTEAAVIEAKKELNKINSTIADLRNEAKSVKKSLDIIAHG